MLDGGAVGRLVITDPFIITAALGLGEPRGYLAYLVMQLSWEDLFSDVYSYFLCIFSKLISSFIFPIDFVWC